MRGTHTQLLSLTVAVALLPIGCAHNGTTTTSKGAGKSAAAVADAPPVALIDQRAVTWNDLRPYLMEAGGAAAFTELVIQRKVDAALAAQKLTLTEKDISDEKQLLLEQVMRQTLPGGIDEPIDADRAGKLMEQWRQRQGMGPWRMNLLLQRNAALRKIVIAKNPDLAPGKELPAAALQLAYEQTYGPKRIVRLIMTATMADMEKARKRLEAGDSFSEVAQTLSIHASGEAGGLLSPIAKRDPELPAALLDTAWALNEREVSKVIAVEGGYAMLKFEQTLPADKRTLEQVKDQLSKTVRLQQEQLAVMREARALVEEADVQVLDPILDPLWQQRRQSFVRPEGARVVPGS